MIDSWPVKTPTICSESFRTTPLPQLRRLLAEHLTKQKFGLYWESSAIQHDEALNANVVLPQLVPETSHTPEGTTHRRNLIFEGDICAIVSG